MSDERHPADRNLALELMRVTEAGALAAARAIGRGDPALADRFAVDAVRRTPARSDVVTTMMSATPVDELLTE